MHVYQIMSRRFRLVAGFLCLSTSQSLWAQQLPPIYERTPKQIVATQTVAEFPANTFLENIAVDTQGNLFINSHEEGKVYRLTPAGRRTEFAVVQGKVAGIAFEPNGNLLVNGWANGTTPTVWRITALGKIETLAQPAEAIFLNGMTLLKSNEYLIADSYKGVIWKLNARTKAVTLWLKHDLLARADEKNPVPGVNGLKRFGNMLCASNTQKQLLLHIPINNNGSAGTPAVFVKDNNLDDFAFDVQGNLYGTTHIYNSVVRVSADGRTTVLAEAAQGMTGSTALAFGRTKADRQSAYVVTNGGMSLPPAGGVQRAKVVRLDIGAMGAK